MIGIGEVTIIPDIARLNIGVQTQGKDAVTTAQANARRTDAVIKAIRVLGVASADIVTLDYSMGPVYAQKTGQRVTIGYAVSNTVSVVVRKISGAGKIFDAALRTGANVAGGITFATSKPKQAREEALVRAITDATTKAKKIAKTMGVERLRLESFVESSDSTGYRNLSATGSQPILPGYATSVTPLSGGTLQVAATVTVRFTIINAPFVTP